MPPTRYHPYPDYRDSGVDWLGEIPSHWTTQRNRYIFREIDERSATGEEELLSVSHLTGVTPRSEKNVNMFMAETLEGYKVCYPGDLVINTMWAWMGALGTSGYKGTISPSYNVYRVRQDGGFNTTYLDLLYRTPQHVAEINRFSKGIWGSRLRLYPDAFFEMATPIPPIDEQNLIADFLDRETARLNALIDAKRRLIELLKEKRAALISHVVTKGLDPNVPMKDSGIEWIGEIPVHWEVLPLRRVIGKFVDYRGHTPEKVDSGVPLITARNIRDGKLDFGASQEFIKEEDYEGWMVRGWPKVGDVLITTEAPLGAVAQIEETYIALAQRLILLKVNQVNMTNDYLKQFLMSCSGQGELWSRATGSTAIGIKASHLREILVAVPPLNEQELICEYISRQTKRLEKPVDAIQQAISRLQEYRTTLIAAAVTGKIDVRGTP